MHSAHSLLLRSVYLTLYLCSHRALGGSTMSSQTRPTMWVTVWRVTKRIIWSNTLLPFNLLWPSCPKTPTLSTVTRTPYSHTPQPPAPSPHTPSPKSSMYKYISISVFLQLLWSLCTFLLCSFWIDLFEKYYSLSIIGFACIFWHFLLILLRIILQMITD